jgi:hypothetical protein
MPDAPPFFGPDGAERHVRWEDENDPSAYEIELGGVGVRCRWRRGPRRGVMFGPGVVLFAWLGRLLARLLAVLSAVVAGQ